MIKQEKQKGTIKDPQAWLKEHDLSITLGEQLPQIGIMRVRAKITSHV